MRAALLGVTLLAGCELVFPLHEGDEVGMQDATVDAAPIEAFDHCAPTSEVGLRYAAVANPGSSAWPWQAARTECLLRGMDLAVVNDAHELASVDNEMVPYWIGATVNASGWSGIDGCAVGSAVAIPSATGAMCGIGTGLPTLGAVACDGTTMTVNGALCETPRPTTAACLHDDAATYTLSPTPLAFAAARDYCNVFGAHLAVIDGDAEWKQVAALAGITTKRLWLGSTFDGTTWRTETTCPAVYSWSTGRPDVAAGTCLATSLRFDPDTQTTSIDGMAATACNEPEIYALCESGST
ncbi:MAG: C-type lectin domain-containing protein [Kofleriaceae bacterium]